MCHISFSLFQIKTKLIYHVYLTILHKFSKCSFPIPFSALISKELAHFGTPKVQLTAKNIPFLHKMSTTSYVKNTTLFYAFCVRGCKKKTRGATRMARGGIRLVHGHTKSTLITYFSSTKIYPKYAFLHAFFLICQSCPFQNLSI